VLTEWQPTLSLRDEDRAPTFWAEIGVELSKN
jgi:hypothetical protein